MSIIKIGSPEHISAFQKRVKAGQLTQEEREKLTSVHEAAHDCVLIDSGLVVDRATIIPAPGEKGSVDAPFPVTFENFQKVCIATLAAGILESTVSGTSNISGDLAELRRLSFHFSLSQDQFLEVSVCCTTVHPSGSWSILIKSLLWPSCCSREKPSPAKKWLPRCKQRMSRPSQHSRIEQHKSLRPPNAVAIFVRDELRSASTKHESIGEILYVKFTNTFRADFNQGPGADGCNPIPGQQGSGNSLDNMYGCSAFSG